MIRAVSLLRPRTPHLNIYSRHAQHYMSSLATARRTLRLANDAEMNPSDPNFQAKFLRELNIVNPIAVVRRVESKRYASNDDVQKEYLKALAATNRLQTSAIGDILGKQASAAGTGVNPPPSTSSSTEPLKLQMTKPTLREEIWATIRTLSIVFITIAGVTYAFDLMQSSQSRGALPNQEYHPTDTSNKRFTDVKGCDEAVGELKEIVAYLKDPSYYTRLGGKLPKGVLLTGPPGTGKTLLARAVAGEAGVPFFYASGSEFEEVYVGVGARRIRALFEAAKQHAPCIVFVDEIDAVGGKRNSRDSHSSKMTLNQLLVEMDGFESAEGVVVIGATNFPDILDNALTRPGRFDRRVPVQAPDVRGREDILKLYLSQVRFEPGGVPHAANVIARGTTGMTGAELENLVNTASIRATTRGRRAVMLEDLEHAREKILMGPEKKTFRTTQKARECTAHHEAGHALIAALSPHADPIYKATILPRGQALGMVSQLPENDRYSYSKAWALAYMDVCMGGRIGEELLLGNQDVTSGASQDFVQATSFARRMVQEWGMSEVVGPMYISDEDMKTLGEGTRKLIDEEVSKLVEASYQRAKSMITLHRDQHLAIANALLDRETLNGEEITALAKGNTLPALPPPPPRPPVVTTGTDVATV